MKTLVCFCINNKQYHFNNWISDYKDDLFAGIFGHWYTFTGEFTEINLPIFA